MSKHFVLGDRVVIHPNLSRESFRYGAGAQLLELQANRTVGVVTEVADGRVRVRFPTATLAVLHFGLSELLPLSSENRVASRYSFKAHRIDLEEVASNLTREHPVAIITDDHPDDRKVVVALHASLTMKLRALELDPPVEDVERSTASRTTFLNLSSVAELEGVMEWVRELRAASWKRPQFTVSVVIK